MPLIRSGSPASARLYVAACPAAVASKTLPARSSRESGRPMRAQSVAQRLADHHDALAPA